MEKINYKSIIFFSLLVTIIGSSCKKNFDNPNAATEEQTFSNDKAATGVAVGIQRVYSTSAAGSLYALVNANGFVTNEFILRNAGNIPELQLSTGGAAVDPTNTVLLNVWSRSSKIIFDADNVIRYAQGLADKNYASGLISFVSIYKALSIGNMAMFWQKIPDTTGQNVNFIDRIDGYKKAVAVLNNAIAVYTVNAPSSSVLNRLPSEVNIINTLHALKARYSLFAGDYVGALAAAIMVDLTKKSTLNYTAQALNPIYKNLQHQRIMCINL